MGCLSSKLMICRSLSYREDFHMVSDNSKNRNEHLLALLNKLQNSGTTDLPVIAAYDEDHKDMDVIDHVFDFMDGLDLKAESTSPALGRSKSCQLSSQENDLIQKSDLRSGSISSRSFHTVEEYDALLEKIMVSRGPHETVDLHNDEDGGKNSSTDDIDDKKVVSVEGFEEQCQRRWKKVGKRLGLLQVPPETVSFRQVNSPGDSNYVTPKFGSYNLPPLKRVSVLGEEEKSDDFGDLVAAFEECMLQLQVEEDKLIKQIDEGESAF